MKKKVFVYLLFSVFIGMLFADGFEMKGKADRHYHKYSIQENGNIICMECGEIFSPTENKGKGHIHTWLKLDDDTLLCKKCGEINSLKKVSKDNPIYDFFYNLNGDKIDGPIFAVVVVILIFAALFLILSADLKEYNKKILKPYQTKVHSYEEDTKTKHLVVAGVSIVLFFLIALTSDDIIGVVIGLIIALLVFSLLDLDVSRTAIEEGEELGLDYSNETLRKNKINYDAGRIALIGGAISIFRHTKKTVKDLENVDSWKEMK